MTPKERPLISADQRWATEQVQIIVENHLGQKSEKVAGSCHSIKLSAMYRLFCDTSYRRSFVRSRMNLMHLLLPQRRRGRQRINHPRNFFFSYLPIRVPFGFFGPESP